MQISQRSAIHRTIFSHSLTLICMYNKVAVCSRIQQIQVPFARPLQVRFLTRPSGPGQLIPPGKYRPPNLH